MLILLEALDKALLPSPINETIFVRSVLPPSLRPANNTPNWVPPHFPPFPPKYTYSFTPTYPPRASDPETIRRTAVLERGLVEKSLGKLLKVEQDVKLETGGAREPRADRDELWWTTWRDMGLEVDGGEEEEIWPIGKMGR